jgi:hypothetical protein
MIENISEFNMLEHYQDIASKYFEGVDVSKMRIGLFGFVNESMARSVGTTLLDSMFRSREYCVSTANDMRTLLIAASTLQMSNLTNAKPAIIEAFIALPTDVIFSKGTKFDQDYEFVIDKDTVISILGYNFALDYDIKIYSKAVGVGHNYSSQYMMDTDNQISDLKLPYIVTTQRTLENVDYVFMRVILRQVFKEYKYYQVIENDGISLVGIEFNYDDQLAYFNIFYKTQNATTYTKIDTQDILDKSRPDGKYLVYDTTEPGIIQISAESAFIPEFNSTLRVDIFTTKGKSGSFTYKSGTNTVTLSSYEESRDYSGIVPICIPITDSMAGEDAPDKETLRNRIIRERATLHGLSTDNDLNMYFKNLDGVNNMIFVKKRSDVIERRFTSYMIPRTPEGYIIPTSTLSIVYGVNQFDQHYAATRRRIISSSSKFSLDPSKALTLLKNSEVLDADGIITAETTNNKLLYGTPYLIVVNEEPESVSFYLNSINQQCNLKPEFINNATTNQFVINTMAIVRNAVMGDMAYKFTVAVLPNADVSDVVDIATGNILDATALVLIGTVYENNVVNGYFKFTLHSYNKDNNYFTFTSELLTDDYLSLDNKLRISNSLYIPGSTVSSDILIPGTDLKIGINVYRKETPTNGRSIYDQIIPNMEAYTLTNIYTNADNLSSLFVDMSNVVRSTVEILPNGSYQLSEVPVVRYSYLQKYASTLTDILFKTSNSLEAMNQLITNNFSIDFKFYRTYGSAGYFLVGDDGTPLDRLDLSMEFNVYIKTNTGQSININVLESVKEYIKTFIELINVSGGEKSLYISNVTTEVENKYKDYIKSIGLKKLNEFTVTPRVLTYIDPQFESMSSEELRAYVPEYVNVPIGNITFNIIN